MNVGYSASVPTIQETRKWPDFAAQYCVCISSRKKDAKLYIAKGSLIQGDTNDSSQDDIQDTLFYHLQKKTIQGKVPETDSFFHQLTTSYPNTNQF